MEEYNFIPKVFDNESDPDPMVVRMRRLNLQETIELQNKMNVAAARAPSEVEGANERTRVLLEGVIVRISGYLREDGEPIATAEDLEEHGDDEVRAAIAEEALREQAPHRLFGEPKGPPS